MYNKSTTFAFGLCLAGLLSATVASAQESVTKAPSSDTSDFASKGVRISFVKSFLDIKASSQYGAYSGHLDEVNGLSAGYAYLPVGKLGFVSDFAVLDAHERGESNDVAILRLTGNLAYAVNKIVNVKGGINASTVAFAPLASNYHPFFGFQAGIGLQATENIGFDVMYVDNEQKYSASDISADVREYGPELAISGTF